MIVGQAHLVLLISQSIRTLNRAMGLSLVSWMSIRLFVGGGELDIDALVACTRARLLVKI
jgi:hypothetical protein